MKVIYKYPFKIQSKPQGVFLPKSAQILHVGVQYGGSPMLWALVDTEPLEGLRTLRVYGTGETIDETLPLQYLGTIFQGPYVWHIFEELDTAKRRA